MLTCGGLAVLGIALIAASLFLAWPTHERARLKVETPTGAIPLIAERFAPVGRSALATAVAEERMWFGSRLSGVSVDEVSG